MKLEQKLKKTDNEQLKADIRKKQKILKERKTVRK